MLIKVLITFSFLPDTPPYIPDVSSPTDTSNFDIEEGDVKQPPTKPPNANAVFSGLHLPFAGFTYTGGRYETIFSGWEIFSSGTLVHVMKLILLQSSQRYEEFNIRF